MELKELYIQLTKQYLVLVLQGISDLEDGVKGIAPKKFPYPIAGNCIPHIDVFLENGYTKEEDKND